MTTSRSARSGEALRLEQDRIEAERIEAARRCVQHDRRIAGLIGEVYPNNYHLVVPRSGVSVQESAAVIGAGLAPLNDADQSLAGWCTELAASRHDDDLATAVALWSQKQRAGQNLAGAPYGVFALRRLAQFLPLARLLATERPDLHNALLDLPRPARNVCRINVFVPLELVHERHAALVTALDRYELLDGVHRTEVALDFGPERSGPPDQAPGFPTLLLYIDETRCTTESLHTICRLACASADSLPVPNGLRPADDFAWRITQQVTITQGFRVLKHYLEPLGLLGLIYDAALNHAFVNAAGHSATAQAALRPAAVAEQMMMGVSC